jgi:magnesium transporter
MVQIELYHPGHKTVVQGGIELLEGWRRDQSTHLWIDIDGPLDKDMEGVLEQTFGLHALALQDASRDRHPPKLEVFDDHSFLLFKGLSATSVDIDFSTIQIAIFVGERFLVTRHSGPSPSLDRLREEYEAQPANFANPGSLFVRFGRIMVQRYLRILLALESELELKEQKLVRSPNDAILSELILYKGDLTRMRRIFHYHTEIMAALKGGLLPGFIADHEHLLNDLYEQQERATSLAGLYYQLASDLIDGYISVTSHRLNQIMKVLTIITAIFVPLSFLAGIYGMNFENMPELHSRSGYYVLLSFMALVAAILISVFKKKRWL